MVCNYLEHVESSLQSTHTCTHRWVLTFWKIRKWTCNLLINKIPELRSKMLACVFSSHVWQRGVGVAPESCLHSTERWRSEPVERRGGELDGERRSDGFRQVSEISRHASPDEAQHPPLQGKESPDICVSRRIWIPHSSMFVMLFLLVCWQAYQYGVYTRELLQFDEKLSMLLLLPPSEDFSSSYWPLVGTKEPGLTMPLQIFELGKRGSVITLCLAPLWGSSEPLRQLKYLFSCLKVIITGEKSNSHLLISLIKIISFESTPNEI